MIKLFQLLMEGRVDDFKKKYASLPSDVLDVLIQDDPSENYKYLDWMGRIVVSEPTINLKALTSTVEEFNKYQAQLGDIYKFKSFDDIKHALSTRQKSKGQTIREEAEVLIDNDEFLVVVPKTQDSADYYGNKTRWCIVNQESWWDKYFYKNTIIILLDRRDNEKYAILTGEYNDYTVYNDQDQTVSWNSMTDETRDYAWPEYVQEAIHEAASNDDIEGRKYQYYEKLIKDFVDDEGIDKIWENYLDDVHTHYDLLGNKNLKVFKEIMYSYGIDTVTMNEYATKYLYYWLENGNDVEDLGDLEKFTELDSALIDIGEISRDKEGGTDLEYAVGDYVRAERGVNTPLAVIEQAVGPVIFDRLYYKGDIDEDLFKAITKYNERMNSKTQMPLPGMEVGKESIRLDNIKDIIYLFRSTGYENMSSYLASVTGLQEVMKIYKPNFRVL